MLGLLEITQYVEMSTFRHMDGNGTLRNQTLSPVDDDAATEGCTE